MHQLHRFSAPFVSNSIKVETLEGSRNPSGAISLESFFAKRYLRAELSVYKCILFMTRPGPEMFLIDVAPKTAPKSEIA
ncbi:hypothetical protein Tco_0565109 [Tanacetum coccineum]